MVVTNGNVGQLVAWAADYQGASGNGWHADRLVARTNSPPFQGGAGGGSVDPYGNVIGPDTDADGDFDENDQPGFNAAENPFRFSTKYYDGETDLCYFGYRYYSPGLGRWLNRDPIAETGGHNLYLFAENEPSAAFDPFGLDPYRLGYGRPPGPSHDPGSGPWGAKRDERTWADWLTFLKWDAVITGGTLSGYPDAARHLYHYLYGDGSELTIDVCRMLDESHNASIDFYAELNDMMAFVERSGTTMGLTRFNVTSVAWGSARHSKHECPNWYYAVGGYARYGAARVAMLPDCRWRATFTYHMEDMYNWDAGKGVGLFGGTKDKELGRLHQVGLAHEFLMTGSCTKTIEWCSGQRFDTTTGQLSGSASGDDRWAGAGR